MIQLRLIETTPADYEEYYKIRCSPSDIFWNGHAGPPNKESFREVYLSRLSSARFSQSGDRNLYLVALQHQNESPVLIGFLQFIHRGNAVELGYSISDPFQGHGFATEALFQAVQMASRFNLPIVLQIRDDNTASQKVAEKNGFHPTKLYKEKLYPQSGIVKLRTYIL